MQVKDFFARKRGTDYYDVHIVDINSDEEYKTNADEINAGIFDKSNDWGYYVIESWEFDGKTFEIGASW